MSRLARFALSALALSTLLGISHKALAKPIRVAATNRVYADVARELGGTRVKTQLWSRMPNPEQVCPADVDIVIYSGTVGDPTRPQVRHVCPKVQLVIRMHDLVNHANATDTALWYRPAAIPRLGNILTAEYILLDRKHRRNYVRSLGQLMKRLQPVYRKLAQLRQRLADQAVIVQGSGASSLARTLSLHIIHMKDLRKHNDESLPRGTRAVLYDRPGDAQGLPQIVNIAKRTGIATFEVATDEPASAHYPNWLLKQLTALSHTLSRN